MANEFKKQNLPEFKTVKIGGYDKTVVDDYLASIFGDFNRNKLLLENQIDKLNTDNFKLSEEYRKLQSVILNLSGNNKKLEAENADIKEKLKLCGAEKNNNEELKSNFDKLSAENQDINEKLASVSDELSNTKLLLKKANEENENVKKELSELAQEKVKIQEDLNKLKNISDEAESYLENSKQLEAKISELTNIIADKDKKLTVQQSEEESKDKEISQLINKNKELMSNIDQLISENKELRHSLDESEERINTIFDESKNKMDLEISSSKKIIDKLSQENEQKQKEIQDLTVQVKNLNGEIASLEENSLKISDNSEEKISELEELLESITNQKNILENQLKQQTANQSSSENKAEDGIDILKEELSESNYDKVYDSVNSALNDDIDSDTFKDTVKVNSDDIIVEDKKYDFDNDFDNYMKNLNQVEYRNTHVADDLERELNKSETRDFPVEQSSSALDLMSALNSFDTPNNADNKSLQMSKKEVWEEETEEIVNNENDPNDRGSKVVKKTRRSTEVTYNYINSSPSNNK